MYQFINYKKASKLFFISFIFLSICDLSYSNIVEELTALNNLYKQGAITKEEYSKAKSKLLTQGGVFIEGENGQSGEVTIDGEGSDDTPIIVNENQIYR